MPSDPRTPTRYWEDFPVGTVLTFGAMEVRREDTLAFAHQFDPQPFHIDDDAAAASLFGRLTASGWHTCAMAMRMMCDGYLLHSASLGSPGVDQLRWLKPVFPGDTLHMRHTIVEARVMKSRPTVGLTRGESVVLNQHDEAVLSMQGWAMMRLRPAGG